MSPFVTSDDELGRMISICIVEDTGSDGQTFDRS